MDAFTRFLLILGRDLSQGLGYAWQQELEKKRQQEIERSRLSFNVAGELAKKLMNLQQTPGYSILPDDARANLNSLLARLSTGSIDADALTQAQRYIAEVNQANIGATTFIEALRRGDYALAGQYAKELEKRYGEGAAAKLGVSVDLLNLAKQAGEKEERRQAVADLNNLVKLAVETPAANPEELVKQLSQKYPEYEGVVRSVVEWVYPMRQLGLKKEQIELVGKVINNLKATGTTDKAAIQRELQKVGIEEEQASVIAQSLSGIVSLGLAQETAKLENDLIQNAKAIGFTNEESAKAYLVRGGMREEAATEAARGLVSETLFNKAHKELQIRGLETQVAEQRRNFVANVAKDVSEILRYHENPTYDTAVAVIRSKYPLVTDPKEVDAAANLALAVLFDRKYADIDERLKVGKNQADAYKEYVFTAVAGGYSEEAFTRLIDERIKDLTPEGRSVLIGMFRATKAAKEAGADEEIVKFASQFNPTTPEAMNGAIQLVQSYAQSRGIPQEKIAKSIEALKQIWGANIQEYERKLFNEAVELGKAAGVLGDPELAARRFSNPELQQVARAAAQRAQKEVNKASFSEAVQMAGNFAKLGVPIDQAKKALAELFDPILAEFATKNYDTIAFLAKQDMLLNIIEKATALVANAKPEDAGKLLDETYQMIKAKYGDKQANAVRQMLQQVVENNAKLRELQFKKMEADLEELRARTAKLMNDIWAAREQIAINREHLKLEWERLKLDQEEFEFNKYKALAELAAKQGSGSLKEAGQTLNEWFDVLKNQLETAGVNPQCFGASGSIIGYVQSPDCKKAIENAIQTNPNVRLTYTFVQSLAQSIMGATGIAPSIAPEAPTPPMQPGTPPAQPSTGQPTSNKPAGNTQKTQTTLLPPPSFKANPVAFGAGRLPATQLFGAQSGDVKGYNPKDIGTALFLMTTEHVPGVSNDNPIQIKHPELAKKAEECFKKEGVLARAACGAQKLYGGGGLNNGAKLAVRHFLPVLATDMDKPIGKFSLDKEGGPLNVVRSNKGLYNAINEFRSLSGLPPLKETEITGRDIAAVYGYRSLLAFGKALSGSSLERVVQAAEGAKDPKEQATAKKLLMAIAYTYAYMPDTLTAKEARQINPEFWFMRAQSKLGQMGFALAPGDEKYFYTLLAEAYNVFNTDRLGQLYLDARSGFEKRR